MATEPIRLWASSPALPLIYAAAAVPRSGSGAQAATAARIRKTFRETIPGTTRLIIAQRISSVQDADRILVLEEGRVNGFDTHEKLLESNAIYREIYETQTQGGGDFDQPGAEGGVSA